MTEGFRGISLAQDSRFSDKTKKAMKAIKLPPQLDRKIELAKINMKLMEPWIESKITEMLGLDDEVITGFVIGLIKEAKMADPRALLIHINGFFDKDAHSFVVELWELLTSAEENGGIPKQFTERAKEVAKQKLEETKKHQEKIRAMAETHKPDKEVRRERSRSPKRRKYYSRSPRRRKYESRSPPRERNRGSHRDRSRGRYRDSSRGRYRDSSRSPRRRRYDPRSRRDDSRSPRRRRYDDKPYHRQRKDDSRGRRDDSRSKRDESRSGKDDSRSRRDESRSPRRNRHDSRSPPRQSEKVNRKSNSPTSPKNSEKSSP